MIIGNKGEWSEIYVLFKLLADLKLFSADEHLMKTSSFVNVEHILRNDIKELKYLPSGTNIVVIDAKSNRKLISITIKKLSLLTKKLFKEIKASKGTFATTSSIQKVMESLKIEKLKAKSTSKTDIQIYVHDPSCNIKSLKKYSIKSFIGSAPTLFNANKTTNIIYEIKDRLGTSMPTKLLNSINGIKSHFKYIDRINEILNKGYRITYYDYEDPTFKLNLELIDSRMPELLSFAILEKYVSKVTKIKDVIENLEKKNPLRYNNTLGHRFYEYRIVNLLLEASLGMTSKTVWTGIHDVSGGIIIVKDNSDIVCYHLIEFNTYKSYLKNNSKLDNPSGTKMKYGEIYSESGKTFIKLNFQIKA